MDRGRESLQISLGKFKSQLGKELEDEFQHASRHETQKEIFLIQQDQDRLKGMMNLRRLTPFLDGMENLEKVLRIFFGPAETTELMAFVWGPVRYLLKKAREVPPAFDSLLDTYQAIGHEITALGEYETLFRESLESRVCLANLYEDVIKFHLKALGLFRSRIWRKIFKANWKDFEKRWTCIIGSLKLHRQLIEIQGYNIRPAIVRQQQQHQQALQPGRSVSPPHIDRRLVASEVSKYELKHFSHWRDHDRQEEDRKREQKASVISWIGASSANNTLHDSFCQTRTNFSPESGKWLFREHDAVSKWITGETPKNSALWIQGKKGAGKTILSSMLIESCASAAGSEIPAESQTAYFYCLEADQAHNTALAIFKGLLHQLVLSASNDLLLPVCDEKCGGEQILSNHETAKTLIEHFVEDSHRQYLIIDGLDECADTEIKQTLQFLTTLADRFELLERGRFRVLFVSCYTAEMNKWLSSYGNGIIVLKENGNRDDISKYVQMRLREQEESEERFNLDAEQMEDIREKVTRRSEGMFLYASLAMDYLLQEYNKGDLLGKVAENMLPRGLKDLYQKIIGQIKERLERKSDRHWQKAVMMLGWLVCAQRPLKWHEMQAIFAFEPDRRDDRVIDFDLNMMREDITRVCGPLVHVLQGQRIQLVHHTARSYVIQNQYVDEKAVQCDLAILCLRYLALNCFHPSFPEDSRPSYAKHGYFAFQDYAIAHWPRHLVTLVEKCRSVFISPDRERELDIALHEFVSTHSAGLRTEPYPDMPSDPCADFRPYAFHDNLLLVLTHIHAHERSGHGQLRKQLNKISLPSLETSLERNRIALEALDPDTTVVGRDTVATYYGRKLCKCKWLRCDYFYQGFDTATDRNRHHDRHNRPHKCPVPECTQAPFGFQSAKDKERHVRTYHPEQSDQLSAFVQPSRRREKARFPCSLCEKTFTRNINLKGHLRSHYGERPFVCTTCHKAFTRINDCKRHEKIHTRRGP